jgi:FkbM family methyltransferase
MNDLQNLLNEFVKDAENPTNNLNLAKFYHSIGQTASAVSYYIRTAERTQDKTLMYACLLAASDCFNSQGCRNNSVKGLIQSAIAVDPKRPEGYFLLSRFYEKEKNYHDSYLIASIGGSVANFNLDALPIKVDYPGYYGLLFEKAVSSWWCGLCDDSREYFIELKNKHWDKMDEIHRNSVMNNLKFVNRDFDWGPTDEEYQQLFYKENFVERIYEKHFVVQENDVVMDLGANCGSFTASIFKNKPKHIYCIEPSPRLVQALKNNIIENKDKVTIINKAVSDHESVNEKIPENDVFVYCHEENAYSTTTFKNIIKENNISTIDFLKCDCEGGEYFVFTKENSDIIKNKVKRIAGEFHITGWKDSIEKFKIFRDYYLKDIRYTEGLHVYERCGKDVTQKIFDDQYLEEFYEWWNKTNPYFGQFMVYADYDIKTKEESEIFFSINQNYQPTSWIVDNFYESPGEVRRFALGQKYVEGGFGRGFIGRRTEQQFLFPGLKERFEEIMGRTITKWEDYGMNGRFQIAWSGEPLVYHCDNQKWGGMLYLTPDAPYQCGTTLYAHKQTRARTYRDDGWDVSWKGVPGDAHLDGTPWEPVDVLGNVYNRLVIFDASAIHSASQYFGTVKENSRLWQMFFFDTE